MLRLLLALSVFFGNSKAFGCAVCGFGDDGTREAFLATTALLTFVPLVMIGSGVFYLSRVAKRAEREINKTPQTDS